jgi:hypothetical protein
MKTESQKERKEEMIRFFLYLLRWQLSSPILALCWYWLDNLGVVEATIIANLIGACLFFFIDKWIFRKESK